MSTLYNTLQASAPRLLYSRKDAAYLLSMSLRKIDFLIADKQLTTIRRGGRVLITAAELARYASPDYVEPKTKSTDDGEPDSTQAA